MKITFEMTRDAAVQAALNAGADDEAAELVAMGIQRRSRFHKNLNDGNQYRELMNYQRNGYCVIKIEVA